MSILLSNDDGIHAAGIAYLREAVQGLDTLHIVAPHEEQSAVGHAITLFDPIKTYQVKKTNGLSGTAVHGTPADCVKLAICEILESPPAFVFSGINLGSNTGISVIYSGTVSAATEGSILGVPSVAFSLNTYTDPQWDTAVEVTRTVARKVLQRPWKPGTLLNVNIPNRPLEDIRGFRVTRMAKSRFNEVFHKRNDPRGNTYYWLDGDMAVLEEDPDSDVAAVAAGWVSITPISTELTHRPVFDELKDWDLSDT